MEFAHIDWVKPQLAAGQAADQSNDKDRLNP
jgi:hypothetical protein